MSFGDIVPNFAGIECLDATGVLSLSFSVDLSGVEGTFRGCGDIWGGKFKAELLCAKAHVL